MKFIMINQDENENTTNPIKHFNRVRSYLTFEWEVRSCCVNVIFDPNLLLQYLQGSI